jgi:O-antigen/teichoic acid export membrane protein
MPSELKKKTAKGMLWSAVERFSTQGIQFLFGIILARLLTPADYGVIAMLTIFLAISQTFIDSGFSNAVIRKIDRTEQDMATMFFFNIGMSIICYAVIFLASPFIASFYNMPELTLILRVLALKLILQSFASIQITKLTINIDFKKQAKISLTAALLSGVVGIGFAYMGYGVWSLVIQALFSTAFSSLLYWVVVRWHPQCFFNKESFKNLFAYGSKLLASALMDTTMKNIYPLIIGKFYTPAQLGGYSNAEKFSQFPSSNLTAILQRVSFPVLSSLQKEPERLRNNYLKFLNLSTFLIFPLMIGLLALAKPLTLLLLTEKWSGMILLLQILCLAMMWYPVHAINLNMLQVLGRSDLFLKLEIIKQIISVGILCGTLPFGITVLCLGKVLDTWLALIINTYYSGKLMKAGFFVQMRFIFPTFLNSLVMGALVLGVNTLLPENNHLLQIGIGIATGVLYYLLSAFLFNRDALNELIQIFKKKR